ncbi:MAG TPA: ATP-dependent RNA helicase HrpA [Burkholderiales bacterium]|nr:ATP-dependent RNA helicase HrpA [Burkholderiales bacterium]
MTTVINALEARLPELLSIDRPRIAQSLRKLRQRVAEGKPSDRLAADIDIQVRDSAAKMAVRLAALPAPDFPENLPVNERREDIARAIAGNQVVIVCGETGSGKTTQLPKICIDLKRGAAGLIACTQPRRIAARSVASRLAQELRTKLGEGVGYKIRFTDKVRPESYIKVMTDGILLAETQGDAMLSAYDTIIIDEAHERSLNIDFLLGYLKQLLPRRPDLKIIITSATIDADRFSQHFDNAPVIEVSGRLYPVEVRYRAIEAADEDERETDIPGAIVDAVDELARVGQGDILVFLPGEREIREAAEALRKHHPPHTEILPLFARLSAEEQDRVFKSSNGRRIVLATNVAETSLTVPGIRYVVDTGLARVNRYSIRSKVNQLQVEPISQAAAKQRAGRCGRVANGVAIRLYSEDDFNGRPEFTTPEILRTSLASVILRMEAGNLGEIESFPFIEPPTARMIADGYLLLTELGAVDELRRLTPTGKELARLPVDPKVGRMLLAARDHNCLTEMLIIASALSVQDPRERPMDKQEAATQAHAPFADVRSDFLSYLKLWEFFEDALAHKKSNRKLVEQCHERFLSFFRMREWRDIHQQLATLAAESNMRLNELPATHEQIHRALLAGLIGNVGCKDFEGNEYLGARETKFVISNASSLRKAQPKWLVAAELTETNRLYARSVAKVEPEWIEAAGAHLVKRHYFDPHWEKSAGQVAAYERVTLYGLTVTPKRRVHYGPINPTEAHELFIRAALVAGEWETKAPFFVHNRNLMREVEALEHKARRQDVLVDEQAIYDFYAARIPEDITTIIAFEAWRKESERKDPKLLFLTREYLMRHSAEMVTEVQYPERLRLDEVELNLRYRFEPGHALDGATLTVPLHLLNRIDEAVIDWLVPGMRREKITWYLKALPKALRRVVVPVPEFATAALDAIEPGKQSMAEALAEFLTARTGLKVGVDAWDGESLPPHLKMNIRVIDDGGRDLAMGRDLKALRAQLGEAAQLTFAKATPGIEREGLKAWDFGDLPAEITFTRNGAKLTGYPALVDEGESVAIRLYDAEDAAQMAMHSGVSRLLRLALKEQIKQLEKGPAAFNQLAAQLRGTLSPDQLREDWLAAIIDRAFIGDDELPRNEKSFEQQKQRARTRLPAVTDATNRHLAEIAQEHQLVLQRLHGLGPQLSRVSRDIRAQLSALVYPGFLAKTPWESVQNLPRYLRGMRLRLDKYGNNPERDDRNAAAVERLWKLYQERLEKHRKAGVNDPQLMEFRWLIEELRVSLFAQELKTPMPVSVKRLEKFWEGVRV